jgi:8-oxo-dGTP pyrophosphatase MutT (NUDIX family)
MENINVTGNFALEWARSNHLVPKGYNYIVEECDIFSCHADHLPKASFMDIDGAIAYADALKKDAEYFFYYSVYDTDAEEIYCTSSKSERRFSKSAGGIIENSKGEIVIVNNHGNSWGFPKGHVDEGEELEAAARREVYEETGIANLKFVGMVGEYGRFKTGLGQPDDKSEYKTITMFHFKSEQALLKPLDPENPEARWVKKAEVLELLTNRKDKEFFERISRWLFH